MVDTGTRNDLVHLGIGAFVGVIVFLLVGREAELVMTLLWSDPNPLYQLLLAAATAIGVVVAAAIVHVGVAVVDDLRGGHGA